MGRRSTAPSHAVRVFLVGAGFNADAVGHIDALKETVRYPLGTDLASVAFGVKAIPEGLSIEEMFQREIDQGNSGPIEKMCQAILKADYYVTEAILSASNKQSAYSQFFADFPTSEFLSFNYDGLIEILLLHRQRWNPTSGCGSCRMKYSEVTQ